MQEAKSKQRGQKFHYQP